MCGILGILTNDGALSRDVLDAAVRSLAHRGPDDSGSTIVRTNAGQLGLAHTRLSIIDLSPLGHQPMHDPMTGNGIVFNGEIYNFRDLRSQLEAAGNRFQSHSDTEVILAAYRAWGDDCFARLRGMFAFALWDASRQRLVLVRDPLGIKPLYYYRDNRRFVFASEVRALIQTGLIPSKLDPDGLFSFLAFGSVYEPRTMIEGVAALPAGHSLSLEFTSPPNDSLHLHEYWNPLSSADSSAHDSARALPDLLRDAVLSHLVSDVPVGVFLSGGIDSSALVAVMSRAGIRPSTFSLVFREEEFNEAAHSRAVADRFKTDHHEITISQHEALAALPDALAAMDQPTMDGINTWLVSAKTRAAGVKVALTGLGADELFAGYSNFRRVPQMERAAARLQKIPAALRRPVAVSVAALAGKSDRRRKLSQLAFAHRSSAHPYFLVRTLFTPSERRELYSEDSQSAENHLDALLDASLETSNKLDPVNRVSYLESHWYMRNTLLRDSDFMSMSHALELRVPFLDRALVEACFRIPGKRKLEGNSPKPLLLSSLGVELPREIVHRPKRGFTLPFERWLRSEMKSLVETALTRQMASVEGVSSAAAAQVWDRFLAGQTSWSRPWSLFVLQSWCARNL